ncbi:MAG: O-antigen ligase family protein [Chitinophagaceae bacterium]|nr:O-antigen ligase family protein [Anaerolineae bacterium]
MQTSDSFQNWAAGLDRRMYAALIGIALGLIGGLIGLSMVLLGPVITFGVFIGGIAAVYVLTSVNAALYGLILTMFLLPFGTLPFKIVLTPTLLDLAVGAFVMVYLLQWMTRRRQLLYLTPVHLMVLVYLLWLMLAFALGLRYGPITPNIARQFAETLLSIGMVFILVDLLRDPAALRRLMLVVIIGVVIQALIALGLWILPDDIAEVILLRLGRIGYPISGVIRYIESNPALPERAIGTWVDPNALGGVLAISAVLIAPQIFARKPVLRYRWLTVGILGIIVLALLLSFSRASFLATAFGLGVIAFVRYRRFIPILLIAAALLLLLPQTQAYVGRIVEAFQGADLATQMRLGEYSDSFRLINRYPIFGVGFTGTPDIDLYTNVASMYLIMANQIGLVGVAIYVVTILSVFAYGIYTWRFARINDDLDAIHLGYHAALLTALVNAAADLYFFRLDFQASITFFWLTVALALASARLAESTVVKSRPIM